MARQNFLSKEFFVAASEVHTKTMLFNLPQSLESIKFLRESKITSGITFLYEQPTREIQKVDVSLLPLNDEFTQVSIHVSYTDGRSFNRDSGIEDVLVVFEQAIIATVAGKKYQKPVSKKKSLFQYISAPFAGVALLGLRKKLS